MTTKEDVIKIARRYFELKKLSRKELNQISTKLGFNSYPGSTTYLGQYRYEPYTKDEAIFDIIEEEIKRE